jgi:REP element-mobilizing transposase RayT
MPGALYYVTSKAMEGVTLFQTPEDYQAYLALLHEGQARHGVKLFAYVLLPDQLHLCFELPQGTAISTVMHALNTRYTKYVARRDGRSGHVFQQRFRLTLIEKAPHLLDTVAGLHRLPQRLGLSDHALSYAWSNIGEYCGEAQTRRPEVQEVLALLQAAAQGMDYCAYVQALPANVLEAFDAHRQQHVVGSEAFVARVRAEQRKAAVAPEMAAMAAPATPIAAPAAVTTTPGRVRRWQPALVGALAVSLMTVSTAGVIAKKKGSDKRKRPAPTAYAEAPGTGTASLATYAPAVTLAGSEWALQIKPMYVNGAAPIQQDELHFDLKQVSSALLQAQGFTPSNYSLTSDANGVVLWETMQTGPRDEVICWRGEWDGEVMRGVMTRQAPGQVASNYAFVGTKQVGQGTRSET